ncbi:hypothetical protein AB4500_12830, partial [Vibrio sp. 10N.222.48.A11]
MNIKTLNELSLLKTALSVEYSNYLRFSAELLINKKDIQATLNVYAAYCYLVEKGNYTAFEILSDSNALNVHFRLLVGFVYRHDEITSERRYILCKKLTYPPHE